MLFNSLEFVLFFPLVVCLFYALQQRFRWVLLLAASYYFYMCWKPEYVLLIAFSTILDYYAGIQMARLGTKRERKPFLFLSLFGNLALLFGFKYINFFSSNLSSGLDQLNIFASFPIYEFILPVGISFYTFQSLSYSIDVYRGKIPAEKHLGYFALFVSFFPQLVAGPIERPGRLIPQLKKPVVFKQSRVSSGLRLMLWGFIKKIVIADRLAWVANQYYLLPEVHDGSVMLIATFFFAIQIYCDFSGYSDIAIGAARVMGYDLMINFRRPYLADGIRDFWRRWHISLSSWFKDYVYIPLGGNRSVKWRWYYNLFITFLVSGFWHGAKWTFIAWGAYHGLLLVLGIAMFKGIKWNASFKAFRILGTFVLVLFGWVLFRADNINDAFVIYQAIFDIGSWLPGKIPMVSFALEFFLIAVFLLIEFTLERGVDWEGRIKRQSLAIRWGVYYIGVFILLFLGVFEERAFLYFQF